MNTLMTNDEYFGESMVGTRDEFRDTLMENFRDWYADYEGEMSFDEYVENALDEHLTEANADEIENCERLNAPVPSTIKGARKSAGLTQEQAARVIGATRRAWQEWEAGRRNMPGAKWELFQIKTREGKMKTYAVLLKGDTVGEVRMKTAPGIGDIVTVDLHDENGMPIKIKGVVEDILEEREY